MNNEGDEGDKNQGQGCHEKHFAITDKINIDFWFYKLHMGNLFSDWFEVTADGCADQLISATASLAASNTQTFYFTVH
jgi:hypothetical protein